MEPEKQKQNQNPSGTSLRALPGNALGATDVSGAVKTQASPPLHTDVRLSNPGSGFGSLMGLINTGFVLQNVEEAMPPEEWREQMPEEMRRPMMLLIRAVKEGSDELDPCC